MYTASITIDTIVDHLIVALQPFVPNGQLVRAQVNLVPQIPDIGVVITEMLQVDLETPTLIKGDGIYTITTPTRCDIQLDFYGENAGDNLRAFKSAYRSVWMCNMFPKDVAPLFCSDGVQSPLITGEKQYSTRWTATISVQYNAKVVVPQDQAGSLILNQMIEVNML